MKFTLLTCYVFVATLGYSQVVDVESNRLDEDSAGFQGAVDLSFFLTKNTQRLFKIGAESHTQYRQKKHITLLLGEYSFIFSENRDFENKGYGHLRYGFDWQEWLRWESFSQAQYDQLLLVRLRVLTGTGPRFELVDNSTVKFYVATLYMYEYEEEETGIIHHDHRQSSYINLSLKANDVLSFANTTYYQPRWNDFSDYRISSATLLFLKVSKGVSFKFSAEISYDSNPVINDKVEGLTYEIENGFSFRF